MASHPPPEITYQQVDRLLHREPLTTGLNLPKSIVGLLLPAVDGDFLQIVCLQDQFWLALQESMLGQCSREGVEWQVVSETEFKKTSWYIDTIPTENRDS